MPSWAESVGKYRNLINTQLDYLPIDAIEDFQTIQDALQIILDGSQEPFPKKYQEQLLVIQDLFNSPKENVDLENAEHYGDYKKLIGACIQARIVEFRDKSENEKGQWLWGRSVIGKYTDLINTQLDYLKIDAIEDFELVQNALQIILDLNAAKVILSEDTELFPKRYKKYKDNLFILHDMLQSPQDYVANKQNYGKYEQLILERIQARIDEYQKKSESEKRQYIENSIKHREEVAEKARLIKARAKPEPGSAAHVIDERSALKEEEYIFKIPDYINMLSSTNLEHRIIALSWIKEKTKDNTRLQTKLIFRDGIGQLVYCLALGDENITCFVLDILLNLAQNDSFQQEEIYENFALSYIEKWRGMINTAAELFDRLCSNAAIRAQIDFLRNNQAEFEHLKEALESESASVIIAALNKILEHTDPNYLNAVRHIGGISRIVKLLDSSNSNAEIKLLSIQTLEYLAHNNQHDQNAIRRAKGIFYLMKNLDNPHLTDAVLVALSAICENNQNNQEIIYSCGIVPILHLIDSEAHRDSAKALIGYLSGYQPIKNKIDEAKKQKPLVDSLKDTNIEVIQESLKELEMALQSNRLTAQDAFHDADGIPVLIKLLKQNNAAVLPLIIKIISNLAWMNPSNQRVIAGENTIPLLMKLLRQNQDDEEIISNTLGALFCLVQNHPDNQKILHRARGIPALLNFLNDERPMIVVNALYGLAALVSNPISQAAVVAENGLDALINTLKNKDVKVRSAGSLVLRDYMKSNPNYLNHVLNEKDIIPTLIKAATPGSVEILRLLASSNLEIQNALRDAQTIQWLISHLMDQDRDMTLSVIKLLWKLIHNEGSDIQSTFRKQNGISALLGLVNAHESIQAYAISLLDHLASGLIEAGFYDKGLEEYSSILKHFPVQDDVLQHRGGAYERLGDYESALKDYKEVLKISPNHEAAQKNIDRLEVILQIIDSLAMIQKYNSPSDILSGLHTLVAITEKHVISYQAIYFENGVGSLVSLLSNLDEEISLLAVKILLNLANDNPDYQRAIYAANAIAPLLSLIHLNNENIKIEVEQLLIQLSNVPELRIAIEQARSFTHFTTKLNQCEICFNKNNHDLNKEIQNILLKIAHLANVNSSNQNALRDAGVIPAIAKFFIPTDDGKTSAFAAQAVAALAKDNRMNQDAIVEANVMDYLIPQLGIPLSASEAALALACLVKNNPENQGSVSRSSSAIPQLMQNLSLENEEGVQNTLMALAYSAERHNDNQMTIWTCGIEKIIPLLDSNNKNTVYQAAFALYSIIDTNEITLNYVYSVINIESLKSLLHSEDIKIKEIAEKILMHFTKSLSKRAKCFAKNSRLEEALSDYAAILDMFQYPSEPQEGLESTNGLPLKVNQYNFDFFEMIEENDSQDKLLIGLKTLAAITKDNVIPCHPTYSKKGITSLVSSLSNPDEEISLLALKILLNLANNNPDYQRAIYQANALPPLFSLLHLNSEEAEQLLTELSSLPELGLAIVQARSFTHFTIALDLYIKDFNNDDRELDENIQNILLGIEQKAKNNPDNQNALRDAGVIPAVVNCIIATSDMKTFAFAARVLAALAKDNPMNQVAIAEERAIELLVQQLGFSLCASEAALALACLAKDCPENQNKIFECGAISAIISLLNSDNKNIVRQAAFALDAIMENNECIQCYVHSVHLEPLNLLLHSDDVATQKIIERSLIGLARMFESFALLQSEQGNFAEARSMYEAVLRISLNSPEANEGLERINSSLRP